MVKKLTQNWRYYIQNKERCATILNSYKNNEINISPVFAAFIALEAQDHNAFREFIEKTIAEEVTGEEISKYHVLRAVYLTFKGELQQAFESIQIAEKNLIKESPERDFIHQYIQYTKANVFAGTGRNHLAIDAYQQLVNNDSCDEKIAECSFTNIGMILIMFGQTQSIELLIPKTHVGYRAYLQLCVEQAKGEMNLVRQWIDQGLPSEVSLANRILISQRLFLSVIVLGNADDQKNFCSSQLFLEMQNTQYPYPWGKIINDLGLALIEKKDCIEALSIEEENQWSAYFRLWFYFLKMLVIAKDHPDDAKNILETKIKELCINNFFADPTFPYIMNNNWYPESKWSDQLQKRLGIQLTQENDESLIVDNFDVVYFHKNREIRLDFSKRPQSIKALKIIAGPINHSIKLYNLHHQLTPSQYNAHLHDGRIYKLYSRLQKYLKTHQIPESWAFTGDKKIVVLKKILIK